MIIIPMAGLSSRFFKAGYTEPKYKLIAHGKTLFEWSINSFGSHYHSQRFIFICRDVHNTPNFLVSELERIGIHNYDIVILNSHTRGQAETVFLSLDKVKSNESFIVFNIDTHKKNFDEWTEDCDAYLEVFRGDGDHWSFAQVEENTSRVVRTAEKDRISNLCSNGLYGFKSKEIYIDAYIELLRNNPVELYISPLFNFIIGRGMTVRYKVVKNKDHVFLGTPEEYRSFQGGRRCLRWH